MANNAWGILLPLLNEWSAVQNLCTRNVHVLLAFVLSSRCTYTLKYYESRAPQLVVYNVSKYSRGLYVHTVYKSGKALGKFREFQNLIL